MSRAVYWVVLLAACGSSESQEFPNAPTPPMDMERMETETETESECTVPIQGVCSGDAEMTQCVDEHDVVTACPDGEKCFDVNGPMCLSSEESCGSVGPLGKCDGNTLVRCDSGWPEEADCGAQTCTYAGDSVGYACSDGTGGYVVTGRALYEDRAVGPGVLHPIQEKPIRGANVWVVRASDHGSIARAVTADDGSFTLHYDAAAGQSVRVVVGSSSQVPERPVRVVNENDNTHGLWSSPFSAGSESEIELLATEASARAQVFNIFDVTVFGMDKTRAFGETTLIPLKVRYKKNVYTGSYYEGGLVRITLAGGADDDGYDDVIILHEFGHYHQHQYGWTQSPGGSHPNKGGDDPRLAWGEGQATNVANAFLNLPYYIDTNTQDGGWYVELEDRVHKTPKPELSMSQKIYEWMVAEILWDVGDQGHDQDDDGVSATHEDVMEVTASYFESSDYVGRGHSGVDLVDWLDGWFWRFGTGSCEALEDLLARYEFPYDFSGPTGCP